MTYTGTTPTYTLTFSDGVDLTQAASVAVTISQSATAPILELTDEDLVITAVTDGQGNVTGSTVAFSLTQEQTIALPSGNLFVQVNWVYSDGSRACSNIQSISIRLNLKNEVME